VSHLVAGLSDAELVRWSGCTGWLVADLVVHVRAGMEEVLAQLSSPTGAPADRDRVSYWLDWPAKASPELADVRWERVVASAFASGDGLRRNFAEVTPPRPEGRGF